jgi:heat shock 70kDa protein 1/2/6/8
VLFNISLFLSLKINSNILFLSTLYNNTPSPLYLPLLPFLVFLHSPALCLMATFVGIDLGTSNAVVFAVRPGQTDPELVPSRLGNRLLPSVVAFTPTGTICGEPAHQQQSTNPLNTIVDAKRVLGRIYTDRQTWRNARHWPFRLLKPTAAEVTAGPLNGNDQRPRYAVVGSGGMIKRITADEVYCILLEDILQTLRQHLGTAWPPHAVCLTVPAHFDHAQRRATLDAARIAGVPPQTALHVANEPTAAAVAYTRRRPLPIGYRLIVYDAGAGTTDVSLVYVRAENDYHVVGSVGKSDLGGRDLDRVLLGRARVHARAHGSKLDKPEDLVLVRQGCERAKEMLSVVEETSVHIPNCPPLVFTRAEFNEAIAPELRRCTEVVWELLRECNLEPNDIDALVLCGGTSRVPAMRDALTAMLPSARLLTDVNQQECVAQGACLLARDLTTSAQDGDASDKKPEAVHAKNAHVVVTPIPTMRDVLPKTLGVRTREDVMVPILYKGTPLPAEGALVLYPMDPHGNAASIDVFQGESANTDQNVLLRNVRLTGLRPNHPQITFGLRVDGGGLVHLNARDDEGHAVADQYML